MKSNNVSYFLQVVPAYYMKATSKDFRFMIRPSPSGSYEEVKKMLADGEVVMTEATCHDFSSEVTTVKQAILKAAVLGISIDFIEFCNKDWSCYKIQDAHTGELIWDNSNEAKANGEEKFRSSYDDSICNEASIA